MKVLLVGHVCIDVNASEAASYTNWGSALMYMARYLRANNSAPKLLAPYGRDFLQYSEGFDFVNPASGDVTLLYRNFPKSVPRRWECENVGQAQPVPIDGGARRTIREADIIGVAPLLPNFSEDYVRGLLDTKQEGSLTVLQAAGYFRAVNSDGTISPRSFPEAERIIPLFDLVFFSEDDHPEALKLARLWADSAPCVQLIVTQGEKGASLFRASRKTVRVAAEAVPGDKIVDSVGCGDIFCAAVLYDYFLNRDIKGAMQAGNRAARDKLLGVSPPAKPAISSR